MLVMRQVPPPRPNRGRVRAVAILQQPDGADMGQLEQARLWWQRRTGEDDAPFDADTPAWALSMAFHVAVLLGLAALVVRPEPRREPPIEIVQTPLDEHVVLEPEQLTISEERQSTAGAESADSEAVAQALAPLLAEESVVPLDVLESPESPEKSEALEEIEALGLAFAEHHAVRGDVAVGTTGASGAVDRLTAEIRASLAQRPTVVCWVFDQSVSLAGQREEIADRLERVFEELGESDAAADGSDLLNVVYAYGAGVAPVMFENGMRVTKGVVKPTRAAADVVRAIREIPVDESGIENTFSAIAEAALAAKRIRVNPRERNVMIVAFTDEVGNDQQRADEVATFCRVNAMRVYVVGVPAPFGRKQVSMRFVEFDPRYAGDDQWPVVDQGPETLYPEVVAVHSGSFAEEPMDSGFGPFSLSKLCADTGGIYFCVHANRRTGGRVEATAPMASRLRYFFDADAMRAYRPDYLPAAKLEAAIAANRAKRGLVEAARSVGISPMREPRTTFPREDDGRLVQLLSEAQREAAVLAPRIDAIYAALAAGLGDRPKIQEPRWQAGYDLALGRLAAVKIRTDAYNQMLADAKSGMKFANPRNDTWRLVPSDDVSKAGSQNAKLAAQARAHLERVLAEHPGTPWALIAADELATPLGYAWEEAHTGVAARLAAAAAGDGRPADDVMRRRLAPPKPSRPLKNL
jgi:hypothetical protein